MTDGDWSTTWVMPYNQSNKEEPVSVMEDNEPEVETHEDEEYVTEFNRFVVIDDHLTKRTKGQDDEGHDIVAFCETYDQCVKAIKNQCRQDVDGWHEFSTGEQQFHSRYSIYKLVSQVQPELKIVAQIKYPFTTEE